MLLLLESRLISIPLNVILYLGSVDYWSFSPNMARTVALLSTHTDVTSPCLRYHAFLREVNRYTAHLFEAGGVVLVTTPEAHHQALGRYTLAVHSNQVGPIAH